MIDHLTLHVTDVDATLATYVPALAPLGYSLIMDLKQTDVPELPFARITGLGEKGKPDLWLRASDGKPTPIHIALRARDKGAVDAFHAAALAAGMTDNGPPGPRPHYHPGYYGAFVLDRDGHNLEVVFHG